MLGFGALRRLRRRSDAAVRGEVAACEFTWAAKLSGDERSCREVRREFDR